MSEITDEQAKAAWDAYCETSIHLENSNIDCMRAALLAALSTPPVGAETGEPVAMERLGECTSPIEKLKAIATAYPDYPTMLEGITEAVDEITRLELEVTRLRDIGNAWLKQAETNSAELRTPLFAAPPRSDKANVVKAGDTVRVLRARNAYGQDVYDFGSKPFAAGETFVVGRVDEESTGYPCPIVFPKGEGIDFWRADDLEVVSTSPVVPNTVGEASCPGCSGTGWQGGNELFGACDDCGGSGKVSVEQKHGA